MGKVDRQLLLYPFLQKHQGQNKAFTKEDQLELVGWKQSTFSLSFASAVEVIMSHTWFSYSAISYMNHCVEMSDSTTMATKNKRQNAQWNQNY